MKISELANPYVGPAAFSKDQEHLYFGREREAKKLLSLVSSEEIALFYAPSGAGKTSLINARLIPALTEKGVEVLPVARVSGEVPRGLDPRNIYIFNTLSYLSEPGEDPRRLERLQRISLKEFFESDGERRARVLILDQFEEILTAHPEHRDEREGFFQQVRDALKTVPLLSVLFSMREDHLAGLDRYAPLLPDQLRGRFRMERLRYKAAVEAIRCPAEKAGRPFAANVAENLVEDLRQENTDQQESTILGEFVEPVQLQVVCFRLWENLGNRLSEQITQEDLEASGDVDRALETFYDKCVERVAKTTRVRETHIRRWFGRKLITPSCLRSQVSREPGTTGGLPNTAVDLLLDEHLIRAEKDRGGTWYELVHDRLIDPILASNEKNFRQAKRFRLLVAAMIVVLFVSAWAFGWNRVRNARDGIIANEQSLKLADVALSLLPTDPQKGLEKALEAVKKTYLYNRTVIPKAEKALHRALHVSRARLLREHVVDEVRAFAVSTDGRYLATAGRDGRVKVWDAESGAAFSSFREDAYEIAFSPDDTQLATLGQDTAKLWDISAFEEVLSLPARRKRFTVVAFSPDGNRLATATEDGTVEVWDAFSGVPIHILSAHTGAVSAVTFSPDGRNLVTGSDDNSVNIWDADSGALLHSLRKHTAGIIAVTFSQNGKFLATVAVDGTVKIWKTASAKLHRTFSEDALDAIFSADGSSLVTATVNATVNATERSTASTWDVESTQGMTILGDDVEWDLASFSRNRRRLVTISEERETGASEIRIWDHFLDDTPSLTGHTAVVYAATFSPKGTHLATLSVDRTAKLWNVASGQEVFDLSGLMGQVDALAFSPDDRHLAVANQDWTVSLWDVKAWQAVGRLPGHSGWIEAIAFGPDGMLLATASTDCTAKVWNVRSGAEVFTFRGHTEKVWSVAFDPGGKLLATASADGTAKVWNVHSGAEVFTLRGHGGEIRSVTFNKDGKLLATASADGTAKVWNVRSGAEVFTLPGHTNEVRSVAFSPDGKRLATGGGDRTVRIWDTKSGRELFELPSPHAVRGLAFSPDGRRLAIASEARTVRLELLGIEDLIELAEERTREPSMVEDRRNSPAP